MLISGFLLLALSSAGVAASGWAGGYLQLFVIISLLAWTGLGWVLLERYTRSRTRGRE